MGLSNKTLAGAAVGVAALAFVGVGAGASFSDQAVAGGSVTTGTVHLALTASNASYTSDGTTGPWASTSTGNGFKMASLDNVASDFSGTVDVTLANTGSLPIHHLQVQVAEGNPTSNVVKDTTVELYYNNKFVTSASLATAESVLKNVDLSHYLPAAGFKSGASATVTLKFHGPTQGGYTNADENQTMAPTLTVTGSDA